MLKALFPRRGLVVEKVSGPDAFGHISAVVTKYHRHHEATDRDVVQVPQWAVGLRKRVADMGISPGQLLAGVLAVAEARSMPDRHHLVAEELAACLDLRLANFRGPVLTIDGTNANGYDDGRNAAKDGEIDFVFAVHTRQSSTPARLIAAANAKPPRLAGTTRACAVVESGTVVVRRPST